MKSRFLQRARALMATNASSEEWCEFWNDLDAAFGKYRVEEAANFAAMVMETLEKDA